VRHVTHDLRSKLRGEVMASYWEDLAPHAKRAALLLLAEGADLLDVAVALAGDDIATVKALLDRGVLVRVGKDQSEALAADDSLRFQFVVVQPWVLAQRIVGA
jgi:hypothetical protein